MYMCPIFQMSDVSYINWLQAELTDSRDVTCVQKRKKTPLPQYHKSTHYSELCHCIDNVSQQTTSQYIAILIISPKSNNMTRSRASVTVWFIVGFFFMLSVRRICCCSLLCHNSKGAFVQKSKSGVKKWKHTNMNTDEIRRYRDESTGPTTGSSTLQPPNVNVTGLSIICYQLRSSHRRCWVESGPRTPPESSDKIISCHLQNVLNEIHATE